MEPNVKATTNDVLVHQYLRRKALDALPPSDDWVTVSGEVIGWICVGILATGAAILAAA